MFIWICNVADVVTVSMGRVFSAVGWSRSLGREKGGDAESADYVVCCHSALFAV